LGQHPAVSRLLKGIFNTNPPQPRYSVTWRVDTVTTFLSSLGPNDDLSLRQLTYKLVMLLALTSAGRAADLCMLSTSSIRKLPSGWETDSLLCPVQALECYLTRTASLRNSATAVLLTTQKPFHPASRDTVANWIRRTLSLAGIDTKVFKAHSTRGASTSKAFQAGVPLSEILEAVDWSSANTFNRFYQR
ncbi:unnamed protein product, partial [Ixodes hexagonus]